MKIVPSNTLPPFALKVTSDVTSIPFVFDLLDKEIIWRDDITHLGGSLPRRFALQAEIIHGAIPRYTKPMDQLPEVNQFTPTVAKIHQALEAKFGCKLNHAILQQYRDGEDHINEHSDKTLDLEPGSLIVNYSAGATRKITFRSKEKMENGEREKYELFLENDSALPLDLETNRYYKHEVRRDRMTEGLGSRISLTFRRVATFYEEDGEGRVTKIWGRGAPKDGDAGMSKEELREAWAKENSTTDYDWENIYGRGFVAAG
jgi:hypothetical protein